MSARSACQRFSLVVLFIILTCLLLAISMPTVAQHDLLLLSTTPVNRIQPTQTRTLRSDPVMLIEHSDQSTDHNNGVALGVSPTDAAWQQVTTTHNPQARFGHGMTYDSNRSVIVLFGGDNTGGSRLNDTWEYDGNDWHRAGPIQSPPGRTNIGQAVVYDSSRRKTIVFGGLGSGYLNDTWEYNGSTWTKVTTTQSPPARDAHTMIFDSGRNVTVLFGGYNPATWGRYNDTWEYNGGSWIQISLFQAPPARMQSAAVYDSRRRVTVLFGGLSTTNTSLNDTWEYDGVVWRQVFPQQSPQPRNLLVGHLA
jgi:hypothetical protein